MTDEYVKEELCRKLNAYGNTETATNTVYRKMINWSGDSRWTLAFSLFEDLQKSADYVNSTVSGGEPITIDSLPARFDCSKKYKEWKKSRSEHEKLSEKHNVVSANKKKEKGTILAESSAKKTSQTLTANAAIVARNVEHVLAMQCLIESLRNVKMAIAQFCDKKRYKTDHSFVALLFSLLNSTNRIAEKIQRYLDDLKVTN